MLNCLCIAAVAFGNCICVKCRHTYLQRSCDLRGLSLRNIDSHKEHMSDRPPWFRSQRIRHTGSSYLFFQSNKQIAELQCTRGLGCVLDQSLPSLQRCGRDILRPLRATWTFSHRLLLNLIQNRRRFLETSPPAPHFKVTCRINNYFRLCLAGVAGCAFKTLSFTGVSPVALKVAPDGINVEETVISLREPV